jgi:hypothetical protein
MQMLNVTDCSGSRQREQTAIHLGAPHAVTEIDAKSEFNAHVASL